MGRDIKGSLITREAIPLQFALAQEQQTDVAVRPPHRSALLLCSNPYFPMTSTSIEPSTTEGRGCAVGSPVNLPAGRYTRCFAVSRPMVFDPFCEARFCTTAYLPPAVLRTMVSVPLPFE